MPAQIRSAYPHFPDTFTTLDLQRYYTVSPAEHQLALTHTRVRAAQLAFLVLLKTCQHLGYFPALAEVPEAVLAHLRAQVPDLAVAQGQISVRTLYTYHGVIGVLLALEQRMSPSNN